MDTEQKETITALLDKLKRSGHRITPARRQILAWVLANDTPFTADSLYQQASTAGIGRATVFRTLKLFLQEGLLQRVHLEDGCQHYQVVRGCGQSQHQDRVICRQCGQIAYLDECPLRKDASSIAARSGYQLECGHFDLYGTCGPCTNNQPESR